MVGDAARVFWGGGELSPAPEGGERTDVHTLSRVQTSASHPAYVCNGLKVRTSLRPPPSGADDGTPPPERTLETSPTTFSSRRVCQIPVCSQDRSCLKFWVEDVAQTFKSISPGRKSGRGRLWCPRSGGGAPSSAPDGGEQSDIRTLRTVRTSASERLPVCVCVCQEPYSSLVSQKRTG
ncbi:hypothetical protein ACLB2K_022992 [Fragaria x ananassa]